MLQCLPELETLYPDMHCGYYINRGRIHRVMHQHHSCPTFARVILRDEQNNEFNVVARFNGLDEQLLRYSGYVLEAKDVGSGGGGGGGTASSNHKAPHSFVYVQAHPVSVHGENYLSIVHTIAQRHIAHRPHDDMVKSHMDLFREAAAHLPWDKTSVEKPFDIMWWLVCEYRKKTEWAATILDGEATSLFWVHHLCPEALLLRPADTIVRLNFQQILDLREQIRADWTRQFLKKTWLSTTFDSTAHGQVNVRTHGCAIRHDDDEMDSFDERFANKDDASSSSSSSPTGVSSIRTQSTHALPIISLDQLERLYRHVPHTDGATIHLLGTASSDETCSFHPSLTVVMRQCPHALFFNLIFLELFNIYVGGSTLLPLNHSFRSTHQTASPSQPLRRRKSMLRLDVAFLSTIELPNLLDYWRCQSRYRRLVHLYHLIYHNDNAYDARFGVSVDWNADIQRQCLLDLVSMRVLCVFSNETDGQVFIMTRDSLENALFYRHKLVQFVARAEERQRIHESVVQFCNPDDEFYRRLNPRQRSVFDTLHARRHRSHIATHNPCGDPPDNTNTVDEDEPHKALILITGAGGTGKTEITKCLHVVEPVAMRPDTDIECYRENTFPRLIHSHSAVTGRRFVPQWPTQPSDYVDCMDLVNHGDDDAHKRTTGTTSDPSVHRDVASAPPLHVPDADLTSSLANATVPWTPCRAPVVAGAHEAHATMMESTETLMNDAVEKKEHDKRPIELRLEQEEPEEEEEEEEKEAVETCVASQKMHVLFVVPMRSQRADARRRLGVVSQTYAHITTCVPHGLTKELSKTLVLFEDELSMQSTDDGVGLMRAFDQMRVVVNVKLGDLMQLDSVSPGNLLGDLCDMVTAYRARRQRQMKMAIRPRKKTLAECLATDDIDYLCERTHLVELTHNHRVDTDAMSLLVYLDLVRRGQTDKLMELLMRPTKADTRFHCLPLAHPDGGFLGDRRPYSAEQQRLIDLYDQYKTCPETYQILTSTNACRQYINAFMAEYAGYTMKLTSRFYRTQWPHAKRDRDEDFIEPGSLRPQANMKLLFRSDFTEDGTTMDSNTIYIVHRVIDVPWVVLNAAVHRKRIQEQMLPPPPPGSAAARASNVIRQPHDFLTALRWCEVMTFPTVERISDPERPQHTRCVVLRNQHNYAATEMISPDDESSVHTFFVVRCSDAFYRVINLAFTCTMHYMQGLSTPNVHMIMEHGVELHQKIATLATSRATRSVTVYSQSSSSETDAIHHFVRVVGTPAARRYTTLWYVLQDRFQISFHTMDKMLGE